MATDNQCVRCGLASGFNRAVVDVVSGTEVGGLCRGCEETAFGVVLTAEATADERCLLCARSGLLALPAWEPTPCADGSGRRVDYEVSPLTPALCDEHFQRVADGTPGDDAGAGAPAWSDDRRVTR